MTPGLRTPESPSRVGGRVLELRGPRDLVLERRSRPEPRQGEALVAIAATGVCGTDVHAFNGRNLALPMTLGHDTAGVVESVGAGTDPLSSDGIPWSGRRVTIDPTMSCGHCVYCASGLRHLCSNGGYLGMTCPGTMADYLVVPVDALVPLPEAVSDQEATFLEPIAVALHLLERIGSFAPVGMRADVVGGGPLGLLLAQTLQTRGWNCTVFEPREERRAIGTQVGLHMQAPEDPPAVEPGPVLVVETSASASGMELVRRLAAAGSVVGLVGRSPSELSSAEILERELSVLGVRAGFGCYPEAIELIAGGAVTPRAFISHHYDFENGAGALAEISDVHGGVIRAVLWTT